MRIDRGQRVAPLDSPREHFELFSIPSYPTRRAEVALGKDIGSDKQSVEHGTVLVSKINPRINRVWIVERRTKHRAIASTEWIPFFPIEGIEPRYLAYFLQRDEFREYLATNVSGVGGSLMRVRPTVLDRYPFSIAPRAEQCRIVAALEEHLSDLDAAVAGLERARANGIRFRSAVLDAAVSGALSGSDSGGGALPQGWAWTTLGAATDIQGGIQKQPKRTPVANHYPFLRVANVHRGRMILNEIHRVELFGTELERLRLQRGDLLIVEGNGSPGEIGRMAVWDGSIPDCVHQNHIIRARPHADAMPEYLANYWNSPRGMRMVQNAASSTSGLHTLSVAKVSRIALPLPPLPQQRSIVAEVERRLDIADHTAAEIDIQLASARRLHQAILKHAFEGRLVPQDPNDEPASVLLERIRAELVTEAPKRRTTKHPRTVRPRR